jgi:hypothetical protein
MFFGSEVFEGGTMRITVFLALLLALLSAVPPSAAADKKKKQPDRAMLEKMDAVPCGAKQKGITGVGSIWASIGITHMNSDEKLCPRYLLRTDDMEYEIQPTQKKHPPVLPVGQEVVIKMKKDRMTVKCPEGDNKTRDYEIVAMKPVESDSQTTSARESQP